MFPEKYTNFTVEERKIAEDWRYEWQSKQKLLGSGALRGDSNAIWGIESFSSNQLCSFWLYKIEDGKFNLNTYNARPTKDKWSVEVEVLQVPVISNKIYTDLNLALSDVVEFFKTDNSTEVIEQYEGYISEYFTLKEKEILNKIIPFRFFRQYRNYIGFNEDNKRYNYTVEKEKDGYIFKKLTPKLGKVSDSTEHTKNFNEFIEKLKEKI